MENTTPTPAPKSNGWKVLGILSVVLGGLSILFSFIPCLGAYAMYSGGFAAILSIVALIMANSAKANKTMAIIGLVISLVSVGVGVWQYRNIVSPLKDAAEKIKDSLNIHIDTTKH